MQTFLKFTAEDGQEIEVKPIGIGSIGVVAGKLHVKMRDGSVYMTDEIKSVMHIRHLGDKS